MKIKGNEKSKCCFGLEMELDLTGTLLVCPYCSRIIPITKEK